MRLPAFELHRPTALDEVFSLLREHGPEARLLAGGTDLLTGLKRGKFRCSHLIALKGVGALDGLAFDEQRGLEIGSNALVAEVGEFPATHERFPALARAIDGLATPQVRNKATVTGNLCNASPCADTATPLMAHGAVVVLQGPEGSRELALEEFMRGPGDTACGQLEVVLGLRVPTPESGLRTVWKKFSPRSKVDIAAVNLTLALELEGDVVSRVDLFLGTVAPIPMRAAQAEGLLRGQPLDAERIEAAARAARAECRPISDFRATKEYKQHLVYVLTKRALQEASASP